MLVLTGRMAGIAGQKHDLLVRGETGQDSRQQHE
jgi:hypothetical protein